MNNIIAEGMKNGISYRDYRTLVNDLFAQGKTTGPEQSESRINFTKLNIARMNRLDKTTQIPDDVRDIVTGIEGPQTWLIITEAWCGDAAQIVPVINRLADLNPKITAKHVLRDEHVELITLFLTNGGRAIPKVIVIDETTGRVIGDWGPRPSELQERAAARKNDPNPVPYDEFTTGIHKWYTADKAQSIQREFAQVLATTSNVPGVAAA